MLAKKGKTYVFPLPRVRYFEFEMKICTGHCRSNLSPFSSQTSTSQKFCKNLIAVHVDDLMILVQNVLEMQTLKDSLKLQFKMKDMGELHYYVGVSIVQDKEGKQVYLHQGQ